MTCRLMTLWRELRFAPKLIVLPIALLPSLIVSSTAQLADAGNNLPPFGSFSGSDFDTVSLQNGNVHISIPVLNLPQRGGKSITFMFLYDTPDYTKEFITPPVGSSYFIVVPDSLYQQNGWFLTNSLNYSLFTLSGNNQWKCSGSGSKFTLTLYGIVDPQRSKHPFNLLESNAPCYPSQLTSVALDGSGMFLNLNTNGPGLILKDGTRPGVEDSNGNLMSATSDTLSRTPLAVTNGPTVTFTTPLGKQISGPQYQTWTYTDSNGATQTWKLNNEAIDVSVKPVLCPSCKGDLTKTVVIVPQSLQLPSSGVYQFFYNNNSSGELQQIVLPTGGSIGYTYSGYRCQTQPDSSTSADCRMVVASRSVSVEGTWKYNGGTVTDPNGNDEVHTYSYITANGWTSDATYETQIQYWSGSSASGGGGTILKTVSTQYTGEKVSQYLPWLNAALGNVRPISQTVTLENGQSSSTQTDYETFTYNGNTATRMNVSAERAYDFNSALLRQTTYAYGLNSNSAYTNLNIVDRVTQRTVYDGSSNQIGQTTYEYDNYAHANQAMVASGAVRHDSNFGTGYTTRGNVTAVTRWRNTDAALLTTTYQFDDAGNVLSSIDPLNNRTSFDFTDSWANTKCAPSGQGKAYVTRITNALNQVTNKNYNSCTGALASVTDPNNLTTSNSYDMLDRLTQVSYPDHGLISHCYTDVGGTACQQSGPPYSVVTTTAITAPPSPVLNEVSTLMFDDLGRLSQTQLTSDTPSTTYTLTQYDALGRKSRVYNPTRCSTITTNCGETTWGYTSYQYDPLSRITLITEQDGLTVSYSYTGNCTTETDEAGRVRKTCSDALGRLTQVFEDPAGLNYETDYGYNALHNLTTVTQKGGTSDSTQWRIRQFQYDSLLNLTQATNPESGTITYTYDANDNVQTKTAPKPNQTGSATVVTTYTYDPLNRLTSKSYNDGTTPTAGFQYDISQESGAANDIGQRTYASMTSGSTVLYQHSEPTYDQMGRLQLEYECAPDSCSVNRYNVSYGYDLAGDETSIGAGFPSAGSATQTNAYNGAARLTTVTATIATFPILSNVTYTPSGSPLTASVGPSMTETWSYDNRLRTTSIAAAVGGQGNFYASGIGYAGNNNVTSDNDSVNGNWAYTYDSLNRLGTAAASNVGKGCNFGYDGWGNRTQEGPYNGSCFGVSLSFGSNNRISGYSYDSAGNLLSDGSHSYTYDAENRILTVDGATTYVYDADGRRVAKKTSAGFVAEYIFDKNDHELAQLDIQGNLVRGEVYAAGRHVTTYNGQGLYFTFSDYLGTERIRRNADGSSLESCTNFPFGDGHQCSGTDVSALHFTGKERDSESGLDNFGARYYGSSMGRFTSADPIFMEMHRLLDPQSLNLYSYVRNNPLSLTDPSGMLIDVDCSKVSSDQCKQTVTDLNNRKDAQFQVTRDDKTGQLNVDGKVDTSKLSKSEAELYKAITDTSATGTLQVVPFSASILGDQFAGKGLNIVDRADLTQFGKANSALPGEILAHAGVEAFESQAQNLDYTGAHNLANQFFGAVRYTDPIALPRGAAMATSGLSAYTFGRVDTTVNVQKIFVVPQPAASVPGNWEHINGNIIVSTSDKKQK